MKVATYPSKDFTGTPKIPRTAEHRRLARTIWWGPEDKTPRSIRYTAAYKADKAGKYLILAAASGERRLTRCCIDGKPLLAPPHAEGQAPQFWTARSERRPDRQGGGRVSALASPACASAWASPIEPDLVSAEAKQFAAIADAVVVAVGFNPATESEGHDRTFCAALGPGRADRGHGCGQSAHHRHSHRRRRHGYPAHGSTRFPRCCTPTIPARRAARPSPRVLFGKHNPEGKLPVSFDRSWEENPSAPYYYPVKGADTTLHVTEDRRPAGRLRHSPREVRGQADGRLPLLDHHRQAPALPLRLRAELHHLQLLQPASSGNGRLRLRRSRSAST